MLLVLMSMRTKHSNADFPLSFCPTHVSMLVLAFSDNRELQINAGPSLQGVPKKPQTIENNLLLEFKWQSTRLDPRVHKLLDIN